MEVIPSSNPDSLEDFDLDQMIYLKEPQIDDPYQESFLKWTPGQKTSENQSKGKLFFIIFPHNTIYLRKHLILIVLRTLI